MFTQLSGRIVNFLFLFLLVCGIVAQTDHSRAQSQFGDRIAYVVFRWTEGLEDEVECQADLIFVDEDGANRIELPLNEAVSEGRCHYLWLDYHIRGEMLVSWSPDKQFVVAYQRAEDYSTSFQLFDIMGVSHGNIPYISWIKNHDFLYQEANSHQRGLDVRGYDLESDLNYLIIHGSQTNTRNSWFVVSADMTKLAFLHNEWENSFYPTVVNLNQGIPDLGLDVHNELTSGYTILGHYNTLDTGRIPQELQWSYDSLHVGFWETQDSFVIVNVEDGSRITLPRYGEDGCFYYVLARTSDGLLCVRGESFVVMKFDGSNPETIYTAPDGNTLYCIDYDIVDQISSRPRLSSDDSKILFLECKSSDDRGTQPDLLRIMRTDGSHLAIIEQQGPDEEIAIAGFDW